jgi:lipopolysaccharide transport system permease protein
VSGLRASLQLAWPLAKRDLLARYRGSVIGVLWALLAPLVMVSVYTLVFQGVFNARWSAQATGGADYALRLFSGLIVFSAVSEAASRATRLMADNANLVKRVVFPLELLSVALVMQVGVHVLLQSAVLMAMSLVVGPGIGWGWLWLPLAWGWLAVLLFAVTMGLAALGCYLRDLQHVVPVATTGLLFLSPVFYAADTAPQALRWVLQVNPVSAPIELARAAWFGDALHLASLWPQAVALPLLAYGALRLFRRLRPGFADLV